MTKKNKLIHTPEGVRDIYNGEMPQKAGRFRKKILHIIVFFDGYEHHSRPQVLNMRIFLMKTAEARRPGNVQVL